MDLALSTTLITFPATCVIIISPLSIHSHYSLPSSYCTSDPGDILDQGVHFGSFEEGLVVNIMLRPQLRKLLLDLINGGVAVNAPQLLVDVVARILGIVLRDHFVAALSLFGVSIKHLINDVVLARPSGALSHIIARQDLQLVVLHHLFGRLGIATG